VREVAERGGWHPDRGDDAEVDTGTLRESARLTPDEHAEIRARRIREERGEGQDAQHSTRFYAAKVKLRFTPAKFETEPSDPRIAGICEEQIAAD
jgi:hypothetical protein